MLMANSLIEKLGWKPGMGTEIWRLPTALKIELAQLEDARSDSPTFRIAFARNAAELEEAAAQVAANYMAGGHLWLCYPKKSGRIKSDITRDVGWEPIHALGLLGVRQIALDEDWSALRFRFKEEIPVIMRSSPSGGRQKANS
ncbi:hypothetical protein SOQ14_02455 [Erythrobacter sp. T5W1-R]|uniref:hypothetical protein n=1 Tax=Erythrobacter sp. T5W1-R TaxID=3101752 RepID=UPI002AFFE091|nr:hypothetical protein [Erythrobacter sp. T5W1-R]MEA1617768.1 hypothetical protein [Erythrobacter sp. T5W1-R]